MFFLTSTISPAYRGCARHVGDVDKFSPANPGVKIVGKEKKHGGKTWRNASFTFHMENIKEILGG